MYQKNDEETLDILDNCFKSLQKMGVRSKYTEEYIYTAKSMYDLQKALSAANHKGCSCGSRGLQIESLEHVLYEVFFDPSKE